MTPTRTAPIRLFDKPRAPAPFADAPPARVLVVDDKEENRTVLQRWLRRQGHEVKVADSGAVALDIAASGHPELVLLDLEMPGIDGYEVLRRLKGDSTTRDIPVIMISGLDELQSVAKCIEAGAEDYLQKPFQPVLLGARVRASLEKKRMRDAEVDYMSQVASVITAAEALESRRYAPGALGSVAVRPDALGRLARIFDSLATGVQVREDQMRTQIEALQAEMGASTHGEPHNGYPSTALTQLVTGGFQPQLPTVDPVRDNTVFAERFEIRSRLGSGGMGVVYRARDRDLDEDVAIKLISPNLHWENADAIERFKSEIRLARRISSPHIIRTHDFGEWNGTYYLTMEYVEGITLHQLLERRGKLTPTAVLRIATQLAAALQAAHKRGVVHRDIKPANLLLDQAGVLKVMDFGVAQMAQSTREATESGTVTGTPAYMSPEQLLDDPVDARTDLYAVGVVMYECLMGRRPFDAENVFQLVAKVLEEDAVPPAAIDPAIPEALSTLVMRLMSRDAEGRPSTAAVLSDLLAAVS